MAVAAVSTSVDSKAAEMPLLGLYVPNADGWVKRELHYVDLTLAPLDPGARRVINEIFGFFSAQKKRGLNFYKLPKISGEQVNLKAHVEYFRQDQTVAVRLFASNLEARLCFELMVEVLNTKIAHARIITPSSVEDNQLHFLIRA